MPTYLRTLLAAFVLLLALPVSAQLDQVATTGGTTVERPRATANQPANRNTGTRANTNRPADRNTRRPQQTRTNTRNNDPNYCPPQGRNNNRPAATPARRSSTSRATTGNRWGTISSGPRVRTQATAPQATQSGVSTSILFGKKGQDVGRAKPNGRN